MAEFNCCGVSKNQEKGEEPKTKRMKLSLSKRKPLSPSSCFNATVIEEIVDNSSKGIIPRGTAKATSWVIRTFHDWIMQRNKRSSEVFLSDMFDKPYPIDIINSCLYQRQEELMEHHIHRKPCIIF